MAKSPVGGSRSFLKGRIGSDVYSLGKDGKGKRQQVVRSLAEEVANPRTSSQMVGRMLMSTVMQAVKFFNPIIDHSFDGVAVGQPSVSEFIRRNYSILKAEKGQYNEYQEKGIKANAYVISAGRAVWPEGVSFGQCSDDDSTAFGAWGVNIPFTFQTTTVGQLRALLQSQSEDDYITVVCAQGNEQAQPSIARFRVKPDLADDVVINDQDMKLFDVEVIAGRAEATIGTTFITLRAGTWNTQYAQGAILSTKKNGKWVHTSCTLGAPYGETNFDTALATYPVGSAQFLNGGDL